ncbi:MAG TPA: hypothetical protein EYP88_04875, partial [Anaerolineales bacterium]|nr:hypothetical protein [Anaerolineales bacterium]
FERIHRSNLVGMGVLPLQFKDGDNRETLGLVGTERLGDRAVCRTHDRNGDDGRLWRLGIWDGVRDDGRSEAAQMAISVPF